MLLLRYGNVTLVSSSSKSQRLTSVASWTPTNTSLWSVLIELCFSPGSLVEISASEIFSFSIKARLESFFICKKAMRRNILRRLIPLAMLFSLKSRETTRTKDNLPRNLSQLIVMWTNYRSAGITCPSVSHRRWFILLGHCVNGCIGAIKYEYF